MCFTHRLSNNLRAYIVCLQAHSANPKFGDVATDISKITKHKIRTVFMQKA